LDGKFLQWCFKNDPKNAVLVSKLDLCRVELLLCVSQIDMLLKSVLLFPHPISSHLPKWLFALQSVLESQKPWVNNSKKL